jgi:hypothetical protein
VATHFRPPFHLESAARFGNHIQLGLPLLPSLSLNSPLPYARNPKRVRTTQALSKGAQQPDQQQAQTFVGQVVKAKNGQYALLVDKYAGKGYYLDDRQKAEQYKGQNVKVTGTLDVANATIRVAEIQPAG